MMKKKGPVPIGSVVADIIARKGLGRQQSTIEIGTTWENIIGAPLAESTQCGQIRKSQLEVTVTNSTIMQELTFRKQELIEKLNEELPRHKIKDIRFRIGNTPQKKKL